MGFEGGSNRLGTAHLGVSIYNIKLALFPSLAPHENPYGKWISVGKKTTTTPYIHTAVLPSVVAFPAQSLELKSSHLCDFAREV